MNKENLLYQINEAHREKLKVSRKLEELLTSYGENFGEFKIGDKVYYKFSWENKFTKRAKIIRIHAKLENQYSTEDQEIILSYLVSPMTKNWEEHRGRNLTTIQHGRVSYNGKSDQIKLAEDVEL